MNFTNLIGAIALATTINNVATLETTPTNKTNIYNEQIGTITYNIGTINFPMQTYSNIATTKARSRIRASGRTLYVDCLIDNNESNEIATYTNQSIFVYVEIPLNSYFDSISYKINYIETLTESQQNFLNGTNYNDFYDLFNLELNENAELLEENRNASTYNGTCTIDWDAETNQATQYRYFYIHAELQYTQELTTDNFNLLFNNQNTISKIMTENEYTIVLPDINYEVIDLPDLMFTILGMPFAWFSTAFNFTIFAGTPYAVNIGSIILSIIASIIAIIVIKIIIKL